MRRAIFASVALLTACLGAPKDEQTILLEPSRPSLASFDAPSAYLERKCGSLDCHGQAGRPLRIHSQDGLRLSPDDATGGRPRTSEELLANYASVVGLEPEIMSTVTIERGHAPERLMLLRKALATERHKGGKLVVDASDAGYVCLTSWLRGTVDSASCSSAP